jgi:hypothetical protein
MATGGWHFDRQTKNLKTPRSPTDQIGSPTKGRAGHGLLFLAAATLLNKLQFLSANTLDIRRNYRHNHMLDL